MRAELVLLLQKSELGLFNSKALQNQHDCCMLLAVWSADVGVPKRDVAVVKCAREVRGSVHRRVSDVAHVIFATKAMIFSSKICCISFGPNSACSTLNCWLW